MRTPAEGALIALHALRSHKLRTFLTLLGNIVGVTSVVAVVSLLDGMDQYIRREIVSEGSSVFQVKRVDEFKILSSLDEFLESLHNPRLTLRDAEALAEAMPPGTLTGAVSGGGARFERDGRSLEGRLDGRTADYPLMGKFPLAAGRHFSEPEAERGRPVAVIGWDVARTLFPRQDPLGRTLRAGGRRLEVIGVVEDLGSSFGASRNLFAVIPVRSYLQDHDPSADVSIAVRAPEVDLVPEYMERARFAMRARHRLRPAEPDDFALASSAALLSLWERISRSISFALVGIVSISLVVGGIVIMNVMLVSVHERTREIGLRKALGARRMDILWQFLVEAVTLSLAGGMAGIALGFGAASAISALTPLPYTVEAWAIVAAFLVTAAVGLFFGLYPAHRAALLDPIEALRHE